MVCVWNCWYGLICYLTNWHSDKCVKWCSDGVRLPCGAQLSHPSSVLRALFNLVLGTRGEIPASHYKNVHKTRHSKVGLYTRILLFTQTQTKCNLKQILTLLWQLIMHYQVTEANQGSKILLLNWMNACLPDKDIANFSASVSQQQHKKEKLKRLISSLSQKGLKSSRSATPQLLQALTLSISCGPTKLPLALQ